MFVFRRINEWACIFRYRPIFASLFACRFLHAFGHLDAKQIHGGLDDAGDAGAEYEAELTFAGILLLEDGGVVVELVVLLGKVVGVVGDECWRVVGAGTLYDLFEVEQLLDDGLFLL